VTSQGVPPTFLLGCYEAPGWGGASTATYELFARMQRDGLDVHFVNLVAQADVALLTGAFGPAFGNPRRLANVHTLVLPAALWQTHAALVELIDELQPDLLVPCGFIAAWLMRRATPRLPLAFRPSGCAQLKRLMREGAARDFVDFARLVARGVAFDAPHGDREQAAVAGSDLILLHSPHVRLAFEAFFPGHMGKVYANLTNVADLVYAEAAGHAALARPFAERDIDIIFVASDWRRPEKNYPLLRRLVAAAADLRIHVVGVVPEDGLPVQHHGIVAGREDLYALLGRSKALVCPSHFDAAPGVLFEASAMGANVVASPNCGNWELCAEPLLARTPADFAACMRRAVVTPLADQRQRFFGGYADLIDTLQAFV